MNADAILARHVAAAIARHRDLEPAVRAIAAELPPRDRRAWITLADALASGDITAATAAAAADPGCWMPLFATDPGDPRLFGRLVDAAARPAAAVEDGWAAAFYPLVLVAIALAVTFFVSFTVVPVFQELLEEWGSVLPPVTTWVFTLAAFMRSIWKPLAVAAGVVVVGRWLFAFCARRSAAVAAAFTRSLARLVEGGVPQADALALAAREAGLAGVDAERPRRPLAHAAVAALAYEPPTMAALLDAVADCHAERAMRSWNAAALFLGPLALGIVVVICGTVAFALLMPFLKLINDLS